MLKKIIRYILEKYLLRYIPDEKYISFKYKKIFKKDLNLINPKSFNEKINWLKLYDRNPKYTEMVDKYEAKKIISEMIGDEYIVPTIGVWDDIDEIDFDKLPGQFVLKCTHDSGGLYICKDKKKLNIRKIRLRFKFIMKRNFYYRSREWPYKNVKPRIIAEKYMEDSKTKELRDYKFFCFNGKVKYFKIDFNRNTKHQANYFDRNGLIQKFGEQVCPPDFNKKLEMPKNLDLMISLAEKISNQHKFLRVDFYEVNGKVYFGEITFYPASGLGKFIPEEWDIKLGNMINLGSAKSER